MNCESMFPTLSRTLRSAALVLLALALAAAHTIGVAQAQTTADSDLIDPPGRVGSISLMAGPVDLVDLSNGNREPAALNWPVTSGLRIETGRLGRAEIRIGSTALRLDEETTVDFARLDDHFIQIAVLRGSLSARLRNRDVLDEFEVVTQRERIVFDEIGRYRIDVDQVPGHTAVTAFAGRARIDSGGNGFVVSSGQRGDVSAPPAVRFQIAAAATDRFDDWVAARDAQDDSLRSAAYVSREATGMEMLDDHGYWRTVDDYGPVWFPRAVPSGWAPYRHGRWAWVDPWGWTWIDEAPWGFAPFHYGRWAVVGGTWGWVPGVIVPRPVYAPALVAWFSSPGISVSIGAPIGWFPLGPREVYVPAYRYSPRYLRVINVQHVPNVERVTIVQTPRYVHRHPDRSTWVPGDRFGRPDPVHRGVRPPPSEWRQYIARPQPPVNVPNTKRRQHFEAGSSPSARPPVNATMQPPIVRPPMTRAVEAPRAVDSPRPVERSRPIERPRPADSPRREFVQPPAVQSREQRGRGELPAPAQEHRRAAPRAPAQESARPPDVVQPPVRMPSTDTPAHRGRGEGRAAPRNDPPPAARAPSPPGRVNAAPEGDGPRRVMPQRPPEVRDGRSDRPVGRPAREMAR